MCFIKLSTLKKHAIGDILQALLKQCHFELLGLKIVKAKKHFYLDTVPLEIKNTIKSIAFKFHEHNSDLKLRKKMFEFKSLVLVLRGRNIENTIDSIYDREKLKFLNDFGLYEATP
jgi:hypothetical protein